MAAFAHQFARLVGPFHQVLLEARDLRDLARLIRKPFRLVKRVRSGFIGAVYRAPILGLKGDMSASERQDNRQADRQDIRPDLCVIGAGTGGLAAAAAAAAFGVNVVLIERAPMVSAISGETSGAVSGEAFAGGALARQAFLAAAARARAGKAVDFAAVRAAVRDAVAATAPERSRERLHGLGVRVLQGEGRFRDAATVTVNDYDVKARRFVIATGSSAAPPDIPGLAEVPYLTTASVFELDACPRHLVVIGATSAGLELAQGFRRFGAAVTVLEAATPLGDADAECAAIVLDALCREGIAVRCGVAVKRVGRRGDGIALDIGGDGGGEETIEASHILFAAGRRPNTEALALEAAGIRSDASGIKVDRGLRTSNRQVYAIGDVTGARKASHLVHHQAALVVRNALFRTPVNADGHAVPVVTFTDPELAQAGLTEDAARARRMRIRILRSAYRENDRARATGKTAGHIKIVTDRKGTIVGATIVGAGAAEAIAAWTLAIDRKLNIEAMAGVIMPYPTYAEVGKRAAMTYFTRGLTSPLVRRIIVWLRRFG